MKLIFYFMMSQLMLFSQSPKPIFQEPLSPRNANYTIKATLDPATKTIQGEQTIEWTNITKKSTNELRFHLYLNAFSHKETTFMRGNGGVRNISNLNPNNKGYIQLSSFVIEGKEFINKLEYISPNDGNVHDSTVVRLQLEAPIEPNESTKIHITFTSKLPQLIARTGYSDPNVTQDFFLVAQWFPKIGVLEESGWNCHQFHSSTEFYSDYGVYNVSITVPQHFIVGATGGLTFQSNSGSSITYNYYAEDVHDFAWTAYPHFKVYQEVYNGISIRFLYNVEESEDVKNQMQALKYAIDYFTETVGAYPYPHLTMVNPPPGGIEASGMEYPTFITAGWDGAVPEGILFRHELVTIHEFGHQLFYGIIGTNEFEHAWLDEGLTSYGNQRVVDKYYPGMIRFFDFSLSNETFDRFAYLSKPNSESVLTTSYLQNNRNVAFNSYIRPAVLLRTLEKYLGEELFKKGLQHYYNHWKFKHPKPTDFFDSMDKGTNKDLHWFFDQFFKENKTIDYEVTQIHSKKINQVALNIEIQTFPHTDLSSDKPLYLNTIEIKNHRDGYFPMDLEIELKDGSIWGDLRWEYKSNYTLITFYSNSRIKRAQLDPHQKVVMDLLYSNNGKTIEDKRISSKFLNRWQFWLHNTLQFLGAL